MKKISRFDKYMSFRGLNDNQVTRDLHLSVGLLGKSRKDNRDLSDRVVERILNFYTDLSRVWLLTGEGEMLISGDSFLIGKGDAIGATAKVTNQTTNNFGACSAENFRADATLNKVLDMLQGAQDRIGEIQKQLTDHNATSVRLLDLLQEKDALILRLTNKLLEK